MPAPSHDPYSPPAESSQERTPKPKREGLGIALSGFLVPQCVVDVGAAAWLLFATDAARAAESARAGVEL